MPGKYDQKWTTAFVSTLEIESINSDGFRSERWWFALFLEVRGHGSLCF
jgi:hypothetical protein